MQNLFLHQARNFASQDWGVRQKLRPVTATKNFPRCYLRALRLSLKQRRCAFRWAESRLKLFSVFKVVSRALAYIESGILLFSQCYKHLNNAKKPWVFQCFFEDFVNKIPALYRRPLYKKSQNWQGKSYVQVIKGDVTEITPKTTPFLVSCFTFEI